VSQRGRQRGHLFPAPDELVHVGEEGRGDQNGIGAFACIDLTVDGNALTRRRCDRLPVERFHSPRERGCTRAPGHGLPRGEMIRRVEDVDGSSDARSHDAVIDPDADDGHRRVSDIPRIMAILPLPEEGRKA
jgi:hypothetical protein